MAFNAIDLEKSTNQFPDRFASSIPAANETLIGKKNKSFINQMIPGSQNWWKNDRFPPRVSGEWRR